MFLGLRHLQTHPISIVRKIQENELCNGTNPDESVSIGLTLEKSKQESRGVIHDSGYLD
jgi:hypothetical protein